MYRTYKPGFSSHELRSVTEEDVSFSRYRVSTGQYVPPPDYPTDEQPSNWKSRTVDRPRKPYTPSNELSSIRPAFSSRKPRQRIDPDSSVFGQRHLADPYDPYVAASPFMRRRFIEYGSMRRPYSPDLDALSLEPSSGVRSRTLAYSSQLTSGTASQSVQRTRVQQQQRSEEREEIKSTTETDIYDWNRYS